ncbi:MAG: chemotaxis protein CheA [Fibrobacteria bacterium]
MKNEILVQIESLAESLVLWDGKEPASIAEKFEAIAVSAFGLGETVASQTALKAGQSWLEANAGNRAALLPHLGDVVSALQDVFANGRSAQEVGILRSATDPVPAGSLPPFIDKKILSDFLARQDGVMEDFESLILDWEKHKNMDIMREMLRLMHTVKGESALLGLSDVEKLCHAVEDYLGRSPEAAKIDLLLEAKDWLLQVFRCYSGRVESQPPMDALWLRLMGEIPDTPGEECLPLTAWSEIPAAADKSILADFIAESIEHLENADLKIMSLETDPKNQEAMNAVFRAFHSIKGVAAFLELEGIRIVSHEVETLLDLVRSGKLPASGPMVDIFLESVDALRKMVNALRDSANHGLTQAHAEAWNTLLNRVRAAAAGKEPTAAAHVAHEAAPGQRLGEILVQAGSLSPESMRESLANQKNGESSAPLGELLVKEGKASGLAVSQALRSQKAVGDEQPAAERSVVGIKETVKVEADRLDRLLDAIGELVIAESMIVQSPELKGKVSPMMVQRLTHLDKITRGLQEMGTSLRMVPIRPVFQKMARLVRDLSKKQGKAIEFLASGDETELDKTVVEKIGDPLVHMIRNAVDHGIESEIEKRTSAGKPASATVRLSAFQKGGSICIKLEDDGRGLNRDAILAKARDNGLIKPDAVLEDREVWQLIFEPGFSTAKVVTETSGRGVGMDVVKRNVEELRGRIDIQSQLGVGTTFSIWLPLTLAIIDGMIVRLGKERFIFPTLSILRIVGLVEEDIYTVAGKGEMLKIQDEMVPLLRLNQLYPGFDSSGWSRLAVIVESDGKKLGIPVDELLGQQQIVIKSLGESFKNIPGLTGGAILSDGNVGMILDVDGLLKCLNQEEARV